TGGFGINVGGLRITAFNLRNPLTGIWLLGLCWLLLRFRIVLSKTPGAPVARFQTLLPLVGAAAVTYLILLSPIVVEAARVVSSGDYVSQRYFWRSAPRGIDLLTLVTGNPLNAAYGANVRSLFDRRHINLMEQTAWIGIVPLVIGLTMLARGL